MLIKEVVSRDSYIHWFQMGLDEAFRRGYSMGKSTWESTENEKLTRMHAGSGVAAWFSANRINPRGYSVNGLLKELGATHLMPNIPGTGRDKEEMQYSHSGALYEIIRNLGPYMEKAGYKSQYQSIRDSVDKFKQSIEDLFNDYEDVPKEKHKWPPKEDPNKEAHAILNQVLATLPKDHQGKAREFVSRRGFTLQALKKYMDDNSL